MRASVIWWSLLLVAVVFVAAGCSETETTKNRIVEACERQNEQLKEEAEESKTKEAKSSEERTEAEHLVECAGQPVQHAPAGDEKAEGSEDAAGEGAAGDEVGTMLTPAMLTEQRDTFSKTCGSCHALGDAKTTGSFGPDLDTTEASVEDMKTQIENGGGGMPAGLLTGDDAQAMAAYIAQVRAAQ